MEQDLTEAEIQLRENGILKRLVGSPLTDEEEAALRRMKEDYDRS